MARGAPQAQPWPIPLQFSTEALENCKATDYLPLPSVWSLLGVSYPTDTFCNICCEPRRWASSSWFYGRGSERLRNEPKIIQQIHRTVNIVIHVFCFSKTTLELLVVGVKLWPFTAHCYCLAKTCFGICHLVATTVEGRRGRNLLLEQLLLGEPLYRAYKKISHVLTVIGPHNDLKR